MIATTGSPVAERLRDTLLVHTDHRNWQLAVERSHRDGGGLVVHGKRNFRIAEHLLRTCPDYRGPILVDASLYAGAKRKPATAEFSTDWISRQRRAGLAAVLPDAGYIGQDDEAGLLSVLGRVHDMPSGAIAPLALHHTWLTDGVDTLRHHIVQSRLPVALVLEHARDPLGSRAALHGLVSLLRTGAPIALLRADASAVGALCFGAFAASVGTRGGLRHLYPSTGGGGGSTRPAVLVRETLSYVRLDKVEAAYQVDPDNTLWTCGCGVCGSADLSWIAGAPDETAAAFQHSVEVLYELRARLLDSGLDQPGREEAWRSTCDAARFRHLELKDVADWKPAAVLDHWCSAVQPLRR